MIKKATRDIMIKSEYFEEIEKENIEIEKLKSEIKEREDNIRNKKDKYIEELLSSKKDLRYHVLRYNIEEAYDTQYQQHIKNNDFFSGIDFSSFMMTEDGQRTNLMQPHVGKVELLEALNEYLPTNKKLEVTGNIVFFVDQKNNIKHYVYNKEDYDNIRHDENFNLLLKQISIGSKTEHNEEPPEFKKQLMDTCAYSLGKYIDKKNIKKGFRKMLNRKDVKKVVLYNLYIKTEKIYFDNIQSTHNRIIFRVKYLY